VCPIDIPDEYNKDLSKRKAIFKQYAQAIPGTFAISKRGTAPCKATCPAHVSIQGYIALINQGKYKEALELFRRDHPFPGVCGRVCHRPCEAECTRNDVDQPLAIRELHRFLADYEKKKGKCFIPDVLREKRSEKVAVIGSGPAGLTAAYYLLQQGYGVTLFEKLPEPGGMMRVGIPEYRLPRDILTAEIGIIENMGAKIKCNTTFGKDITLDSLKSRGYSACFLAIGLHGGRKLGVENEKATGVLQGVDFLRDVALGKEVDIGEDVIVVGGGNVAVDVALTAKRKGAEKVTLVCLEKREEMPALEHEIKEALEGDIEIINSFGPKSFFIDTGNNVSGIEFKSCTAVYDENGRFAPQYDADACQPFWGDTVIIAVGQSMETAGIKEMGVALSTFGRLEANPRTLQTPLKWVFAGGDAVYGPKSVVDAVACGKQAAQNIHRYINGSDLINGRIKAWCFEKPDVGGKEKKARIAVRCLDPSARKCNFLEVSFGYNQQEAQKEAERCLKCGICAECYQCVSACLSGAVDHDQQAIDKEIKVGSVIISSGVDLYNPEDLAQFYHYGTNPNVMTSLEFERILSASGPTMGDLVRPSDQKEPRKIAWLQCVGSRDINRCGNGYCSSVCCMYAIKDAVIAKEHSHGELDTVIFYMDIRSHGKDYEKYYRHAEEKEGVRFVRSRIHTLYDDPVTRNLKLVYTDETGTVHKEVFDMVVLSVGLQVGRQSVELAQRLSIDLNKYKFIHTEPFAPVTTSRPGVYTCGVFQEPKDIPSSVTEASAAASAAGLDVAEARGTNIRTVEIPEEMDVAEEDPRIGVFVCNCGINIGGVVDVPEVQEYAATLSDVVFTDNNLFTCSQDTQEKIKEKIKEKKLNRVVVASCSPKTHSPMFMETLEAVGLNKYLFEMANIRNQNSWVHINNPDIATEKAKDLVRMAVARARTLRPLTGKIINVDKRALVIGGGIAGMNAALDIGRQGFKVTIIEKEKELGGMARRLHHTIEGADIQAYLRKIIDQVTASPKIEVLTNTWVIGFDGFQGNFTTEVAVGSNREIRTVEHGVIVVATGANEYQPKEFLCGRDKRVVTQISLTDYLEKSGADDLDNVVMIQCVGSRNEENPNCSRICCQSAVKNALLIKVKNPKTNVYILYRDIRTYGFLEDYYSKARKLGVIFIRYDKDAPPTVVSDDDGLLVAVKDHVLCRDVEIRADLLALSAGVTASDTKELGGIMKLNRDLEGFFIEAHVKLRPVDMPNDAAFLCGMAHSPKLISETIVQSKAAASRAVTFLAKDEIQLSAITAKLDLDHCVKCLTCARSCPYGVPKFNVALGEIEIDEAMCHGCGVCAAVCPRRAIGLSYYEDDQILCKIDALLG
jgi:heterodisulfide reductase subunit A-like polyferredoxin